MSSFNNLSTFANQNFGQFYGGQGGMSQSHGNSGSSGGHSSHNSYQGNNNNNNNNNNSNNAMYRIPNRIFVGGIPQTANQNELREYFASFGHVKDARIITDPRGNSRGYGFVTYENENDANKVLSVKDQDLMFKENKLNVGHAFRKKNNQQGGGQGQQGGHHQHSMGGMSGGFSGGMNLMGMQAAAGNGHHAPPHHHHAHHYGAQANSGAIGAVGHQQQHRGAPNTYLDQQQQMQMQYGQQHGLNGMHM